MGDLALPLHALIKRARDGSRNVAARSAGIHPYRCCPARFSRGATPQQELSQIGLDHAPERSALRRGKPWLMHNQSADFHAGVFHPCTAAR